MDRTNGYVFLWRRIVESLDGDGVAQAVMCQLLARVTHQDYRYLNWDLRPGEVILSTSQLAQYTGFAKTTVHEALIRLQKRGTIRSTLAGRSGQLLTLVNWRTYQNEIDEARTLAERQRSADDFLTVSLTRTKQEEGNSSSDSSPKKRNAKFDPDAWARGEYDTPDMGGMG
jgi:DNA-binding transcriptional MocR family regulator